MNTLKVDINCDLGEGFGPYRMGDDSAMLEIVSSANVACGFHAGDPVIMDRVVRQARARGVDIGAHVGFEDRAGFGRRAISLSHLETEKMVLYQLGALHAIAKAAGHRVSHMSFHGALGNLSFVDRALSEVLVRATRAFDPSLPILVVPNTELERATERAGLRPVRTFLADRAYDEKGTLVSRKAPGSLIENLDDIAARVVQMIAEGTVRTIDGKLLTMSHESILVHGDTPRAVEIARTVRATLERLGVTVTPLSGMGMQG
jgi:UPF0271 protein